MKTNIVDGYIPYTLGFAEALTVTHNESFSFSNEQGSSLYSFICVASGEMLFSFSEAAQDIRAKQGQVIYIPKGCRYTSTYLPDAAQVVIFRFDLHPSSPEQPSQNAMLLPAGTDRLFHDGTSQYALFDRFRCAARIYDLLGILVQAQVNTPKRFKRLLPAVDRIEGNPSESLPVSFYAELCGMSVPGFRRSFREYMGQNPIEYRNDLRLLLARKLLASGEYTVEEAAAQSGFTNLSFFYRLFRRKFGQKPGSI